MNDYKKELVQEGILIPEMRDCSLIEEVQSIVNTEFDQPTGIYLKMSRSEFQDRAKECQDKINELGLQKKFYLSEKGLLENIWPNERIMFESVVFFRAVRPVTTEIKEENPDFHRETMYTDHEHTKHVVNVWIPIKNVCPENTLRYVPRSHLIPDENLVVGVNEEWPGKVEKYSSGHKLGFLWKPKSILEGVDLSRSEGIHFPENSYSMFSSMLVHGGATNRSHFIRFAIGFGLIPESKMAENKSFFASGGKEHYTLLTDS